MYKFLSLAAVAALILAFDTSAVQARDNADNNAQEQEYASYDDEGTKDDMDADKSKDKPASKDKKKPAMKKKVKSTEPGPKLHHPHDATKHRPNAHHNYYIDTQQ